MTVPDGKIAVTEHIWVEWLQHRRVPALCPNCGQQVEAGQILGIDYRPPVEHKDEHRFIMQVCPA